ncbi:MAG: BTAD domain-containing putative transcriptional regulator [Thermomicrobiales bacterium]
MDTLKIYALGPLEVCQGDQCFRRFATAKVQQLLGYLCVHRERLHSRETLAELFWGEISSEHARGNLRTSLWRLRRVLEPEGNERGQILVVERDAVGLNTQNTFWLDLQVFEEASRLARRRPLPNELSRAQLIDRLATAVNLYRGDLLDGCYDDWCLYERERLKDLFLSDLACLIALHRDVGDYAQALRYGQRLLSQDPLLEEVHRNMMQLYFLEGNRASAIRQYQQCQQILARELNIEPMEETRALYADIVADRAAAVDHFTGPSVVLAPASLLDDPLHELRIVQSELENLQNRLTKGIQTFESLRQLFNDPNQN